MSSFALVPPADVRVPPHNIDAEKSVLGAIFIKPALFGEVATDLQGDEFFLPQHCETFEAMLAVDRRRQPIDIVTVADELKARGVLGRLEGGESYLVSLANAVPTAENVSSYINIVREKAQRRRLAVMLREATGRAEGADDLGEILDDATQGIRRIESGRSEIELATVGDIAAAETEPLPEPISTGLEPLDTQLGGGLFPGAPYAFPGPTGRGKTALAVQTGTEVSLVRPVVYVSTEIDARQVVARAAAPLMGRPWLELWQRLHLERDAVARALEGRRLHVVDGTRRRDLSPVLMLDRVAQRYGEAPLVVVDYLQDLARRRASAADDRRLAVAAASDEIRQWCLDARGYAIMVSSAARTWGSESTGERSTRDYANASKESGDVDFDCAGIVFVDIAPCPPGGTTTAILRVAKSRYYTPGEVRLEFEGATGAFRVPSGPGQVLTPLELEIVEAIRSGADSRNEIFKVIGGTRAKVLNAVNELVRRGVLNQDLEPSEGVL